MGAAAQELHGLLPVLVAGAWAHGLAPDPHRTKRTMGLGSLYGENDLLDLDGDPQKERQVAEKQLAQLGDIL